MEFPELLTAYNKLQVEHEKISSGYEQCRLNLEAQESHISQIIEQHSHPIYVDFLIAIFSVLVYHYTRKYWDLLQELAFEAWCWAGMKIMPDKSFDCRACWRAAQVSEGLCQSCYKEAHGAEPAKEEKESVSANNNNTDQCAPMRKELKQCASCGLQKPPKAMALDGSIDLCNQCYSKETGDPMGAIRDGANF